jgi:SAM-dependent methyltransferase
MGRKLPSLYSTFADWFHLLTAPEEYAEEANVYTGMLRSLMTPGPRTVLELGSGGGNNASHMKAHFELTLTDISPEMLAVSRSINPECEHVLGDMRELRLGRQFDAVFAHDALDYLLTLDDLARMAQTAWAHCRPGGAVLLVPDGTRETFRPATEHGGHDGPQRALRYLEWSWDPDPSDQIYNSEMVYLMRHADGNVQVQHEQHLLGLFSRADWLAALTEAGFYARSMPFDLSGMEPGSLEAFAGVKPPS